MQQDHVNSSSGPRDENHDHFLALYHQHERKLKRYAKSLSRPPISSDDILQEAVLQAMQKFPALRNEARFTSWYSTIIFRTYLRLLEKMEAERRRSIIYAERRLSEQKDHEAEIFEEIDSRLDKFDPGTTVDPHANNTTFQGVTKSRLSHVDEAYREIIREGMESFSELQNEEDFHPWILEKSKKARKRVRKNQRKNDKGKDERE